ncbi:MAG: hypothetical protein ABI837_11795 [Acidobacteriota bacterium]
MSALHNFAGFGFAVMMGWPADIRRLFDEGRLPLKRCEPRGTPSW